MSAQITITIKEDMAIIKVVGRAGLQDILDANEQLTHEGKYIYPRRFWDLRECLLDLSAAEVETIANSSDQYEQSSSKVAILATNDLTFGLSRMFQVFRQSKYINMAVFRDEGKAIRWLLSD